MLRKDNNKRIKLSKSWSILHDFEHEEIHLLYKQWKSWIEVNRFRKVLVSSSMLFTIDSSRYNKFEEFEEKSFIVILYINL